MALASETKLWPRFVRDLTSTAITAASEIRLYGINAAGVTALVNTTNQYISEVPAGHRTHGPTATVVTFSSTTGQFTGTDLTDAFTDNNSGNGPTTGLLWVAWNGTEGTSPIIGHSTDATNLPLAENGTDDTVAYTNPLFTLG